MEVFLNGTGVKYRTFSHANVQRAPSVQHLSYQQLEQIAAGLFRYDPGHHVKQPVDADKFHFNPPTVVKVWIIITCTLLLLFVIIAIVIATDLKTGRIFKENGAPFLVVRYEHVKSARGGANVKVKAKNLLTGSVIEKGYMAGDSVEEADIYRKNSQYLYKDDAGYNFMDPVSFEQFSIDAETVDEQGKYLKEGDNVVVVFFEDRAISVELPNSLIFEVAYTEPGFKGNTVSNVYKDAELENGMKARVPMFIKIGEKVKIDTRTGEYLSKA